MPPSASFVGLLAPPLLVTTALSAVRLLGEVQGWFHTHSGGRLHPLGITWCIFVFGAWFGWRLSRQGSAPRVRLPWLWALLAMAAAVAAAIHGFRPLVGADRSEATFGAVREAVVVIVTVTAIGGASMFLVWPRLAQLLLCYGLGARAVVLVLTWLAKGQGWDTHYTKFGPPGIERESIGATMLAAGFAQLGFWVPFTILGGTLAATVFGRLSRSRGRGTDPSGVRI
jgi:hypothetical protein